LKKFTLLILIIFSLEVLADSPRGQRSDMPAASDSSGGVQGQSGQAEDGDKTQVMFGQLGVTIGSAYIIAGLSSCWACNWYYIGIGAAGVVVGQALVNDGAASGAGARNAGARVTNGGQGITPEEFQENSPAYQQYVAAINDLAKAGYKLDKKTATLTTPTGGVIGPNTTGAEMAAMGIPVGGDDMLKKGLKDILAAAKDKASKYDSDSFSDGGGGPSMASAQGGYDDQAGAAAAQPAKVKLARGPTDVSGLSKMHGGVPIGVAGDDIFMMMKRRYEDKGSQGAFLLLQTR
jgi:hypothetical protein